MDAKLKQIILDKYNTNPKGWYAWLTRSKENYYLLDALNQEYPYLHTVKEQVYWLVHDLTEFPKCPTCGKVLTDFGAHRSLDGTSRFCYPQYCGSSCAASNQNTILLRKKTSFNKYGTENYNNPEKTTTTCRQRYGSGRNNEKVKATMLARYGVTSFLETLEVSEKRNDFATQQKIQQTKRINGTFNISRQEENFYLELLKIFDESDIIRQYKDQRYPFNCDFYIKSKDLFIELNLNWTHGDHPFDENNTRDLERKNLLIEKSKHSKFYKNALDTWTVRDVNKLTSALNNNLKYLCIYTKGQYYYEEGSLK